MQLYVAGEWQGDSGYYYISNITDLGNNSGYWGHLLKIFDVDVDNLVKLLVDEFHVDYINYYIESDVLIYYWKSLTAARKFKNELNKKAREKKYMI